MRGVGLMWGVDVMGTAAHVVSESLARGLLVCSAGDYTVRLLPPLVIREEEAKQLVSILSAVVKAFLSQAPAAAAA